VAALAVDAVATVGAARGRDDARRLYQRLARTHAYPLAFWQRCTELEMASVPVDVASVDALFERQVALAAADPGTPSPHRRHPRKARGPDLGWGFGGRGVAGVDPVCTGTRRDGARGSVASAGGAGGGGPSSLHGRVQPADVAAPPRKRVYLCAVCTANRLTTTALCA
jgi:hypothetical protein